MVVEVHGREVVQLPVLTLSSNECSTRRMLLAEQEEKPRESVFPLWCFLNGECGAGGNNLVVVEVHGREVVQLPVPLFLLHLIEPKSFS